MTVATEVAKRAQRLEYFVTIEGIGWPVTWSDLANGFEGVIWATNDINGDLNDQITGAGSLTIYKGLHLPESIGYSLDPRTCEFSVDGLDIKIQDDEEWWTANFTPRKEATKETTLNAQLEYGDTTVQLADGTNFAQSDAVWIGGRELVVLGAKALVGGTVYNYTGSTRARHGCQRGSSIRDIAWGFGNWPVGTGVIDIARFWWNRKAALWAHVPGEAVSNCLLLWYGALRSVKSPAAGVVWDLSCVSDFMSIVNRTWRPHEWEIYSDRVCSADTANTPGSPAAYDTGSELWHAGEGMRRTLVFSGPVAQPTAEPYSSGGKYDLALFYHYRPEYGGLANVKVSWDAATPQAVDNAVTGDSNIIADFLMVNDSEVIWAIKEEEEPNQIIAEIVSRVGTTGIETKQHDSQGTLRAANVEQELTFASGSRARFLLSNWIESYWQNRYYVQTATGTPQHTRNPIDLLLIHLTSMDKEIKSLTVDAGSTATVIQILGGGMAVNGWAGFALFIMDGSYKWQARTILSNTATAITVDRGFTGAPAAADHLQVRNSVYDTLPLGWGLGVHKDWLDVSSFEALRDAYWPMAAVDRFILGDEDEIDIWELLRENICKPYGVLVYFNRNTRKISARYVGHSLNADSIDGYTQINRSDIVKPGNLEQTFSNPVGSVSVKVRSKSEKIIGVHAGDRSGLNYFVEMARTPGLMKGAKDTVTIRSAEIESAFNEQDVEQLTFNCGFDTRDTCGGVIVHLQGMLGAYNVPPPGWSPELRAYLWYAMHPGDIVNIDWDTVVTPVNPFTGARGWSNVLGRLLRASLPLNGRSLSFAATFELLAAFTRGKIAPAATVTAKGVWGFMDHFVVNNGDWVCDPDSDVDWYHFAVGDMIELRSATGAVKEAETINSFGANESPTPEGADQPWIVVNGAIGSAIAAGDYVTFQNWAAGMAREKDYSAYGASGGVLGAADPLRRYS